VSRPGRNLQPFRKWSAAVVVAAVMSARRVIVAAAGLRTCGCAGVILMFSVGGFSLERVQLG